MQQIIGDDIDSKLYVLTITEQLTYEEPKLLRSQIKTVIEKTVESWGLESRDVCIIGPNEDREIQVTYKLTIPNDGKNKLTGTEINLSNGE